MNILLTNTYQVVSPNNSFSLFQCNNKFSEKILPMDCIIESTET